MGKVGNKNEVFRRIEGSNIFLMSHFIRWFFFNNLDFFCWELVRNLIHK